MNIKNSIKFILVVAAFAGLITNFSSCDKDPVPVATKVFGTITLENADIWELWQDSGVVELTIFPEFSLDPLAGWGEIPDDFFGPGALGGTFAVGAPYNSQDPVIYNYEAGKTTFDYEIELEPGTYSALALGFRHNGITDPSLKTATLGAHWGNSTEISHGIVIRIQAGPSVITIFDYPEPSDITIKEGEQLEINFTADFDFVNEWYQ